MTWKKDTIDDGKTSLKSLTFYLDFLNIFVKYNINYFYQLSKVLKEYKKVEEEYYFLHWKINIKLFINFYKQDPHMCTN